jgi:ferric-dicitrate binding protein FerR (iron transport regulator)
VKIRSNSTDFCKLVVRLAVLTAACANFAAAQTGAEAKVISMSGQVSVMKGSGQWALNAGDLIQPMQTIVTGPDGTAVLQVADRSTIDIYPNSQFVFRNNPGDFKDLVDLFLGKIKVKIEHFGGVPNNNKVRTPTAVIAVRGTIFDVEVDGRDETTVVQCEEGQVRVSHFDMPGGGSRDLGPGESVTVFKNQPLAKKSNLDRGAVAQKIVRMATDAASQILLNRSTGGGSTGASGTGTSTSGDKAPPAPPTGGAPPTPAPGH